MSNSKREVARKFVQVSLPAAFADALREQADVSNRSMAAQLEHWARIAKAVEMIAPTNSITRVKSAKNSTDILNALASFVMEPNVDALRSRLNSSGVVRYGPDPAHPSSVLEYRPDGTIARGSFNAEGDFLPDPPAANQRSTSHAAKLKQSGRLQAKHPSRVTSSKTKADCAEQLAHA